MILLTGFGPFAEIEVNPSQVVAERLDGSVIGGLRIVSLVLPVAFGEDVQAIRGQIKESAPVALLSLGVNAAANTVLVETTARNRRQSDGGIIPIDPAAAVELPATLPVHEVQEAIRASGIPCDLSDDAGTYLCNHTMFWGLRLAADSARPFPSGFIHIPLPRGSDNSASPAPGIDQLESAVRAAIGAIATHLLSASSGSAPLA